MQVISWNKINPVCVYRWNFIDDICGICQEDLMGLSSECAITNQKIDKCAPIKSTCGHAFHKDCISQWLNERNKCPLCMKKWEPVKYNNSNRTFLPDLVSLDKNKKPVIEIEVQEAQAEGAGGQL